MAAKKKKKKAKKKKGSSPGPKRSTNKTELKLDLRKGSAVDGGPSHLYHVGLKSSQGSVTAGAVVAKSDSEAKAKAKRLLRTLAT